MTFRTPIATSKIIKAMKVTWAIGRIVFTVMVCAIVLTWRTLLFIIDLIDGGDGNVFNNTHAYNYLTGEVDSFKRVDGLYDNYR